MIEFPSRITQLIQRIEAGETVTPEEADRIARLQSLDLAKLGEDFARDLCRREEEVTEQFKQLVEQT